MQSLTHPSVRTTGVARNKVRVVDWLNNFKVFAFGLWHFSFFATTQALCVGPLKGIIDRIKAHVQDYLSQIFTAEMLRAESEETKRALERVWEKIERRLG